VTKIIFYDDLPHSFEIHTSIVLLRNLQLHRMLRNLFLLFCCISVVNTNAQQVLTIDSAIQIGLKDNYDILIARQQDAINRNNVFAGNAGMLPNVSLNGSPVSDGWYNTKYKYSNSESSLTESGVNETDVDAYAELNWTLFDGFKMFATYNQLKVIRDQSADNLKNQIQTTISGIISAYYNVWYQKQLTRLQQTSDSINMDNLTKAKQQFAIGENSKLNYLQALVNFNASHSAFLTQQIALTNAKDSLNRLLTRPINTYFDVNDALPGTGILPLDSIKQKVFSENPSLLSADKESTIALFGEKEVQGGYYPKISLIGEYGYSNSTTGAGLVLNDRAYGPSIGVAATWTIYNGSVLTHQLQNSKIDVLISDLQYDNIKTLLDEQTETAYNNYENNLQLQRLEMDNEASTKEYLDLSLQQYKVGQISGLDFNTAEQNYINEQMRLFADEFNTQLSRFALIELTGELVR